MLDEWCESLLPKLVGSLDSDRKKGKVTVEILKLVRRLASEHMQKLVKQEEGHFVIPVSQFSIYFWEYLSDRNMAKEWLCKRIEDFSQASHELIQDSISVVVFTKKIKHHLREKIKVKLVKLNNPIFTSENISLFAKIEYTIIKTLTEKKFCIDESEYTKSGFMKRIKQFLACFYQSELVPLPQKELLKAEFKTTKNLVFDILLKWEVFTVSKNTADPLEFNQRKMDKVRKLFDSHPQFALIEMFKEETIAVRSK